MTDTTGTTDSDVPEVSDSSGIIEVSSSTNSIATSSQNSRVTVSADGTIYLPTSAPVTFAASKPESSPWPPDVRNAVICTEKPSTRLQKYLAVLFIFAILCIGFFIIYMHSQYRITELKYPALTEGDFLKPDKENRNLYMQAKALADAGKHAEAFQMLKDKVDTISSEHQREYYLICAECFENLTKNVVETTSQEQTIMIKALNNLMKDEPDRILWIRYYADIACRDYYDYETIWCEIKDGKWKNKSIQSGKIEKCIDLLAKAERQAKQQNDPSFPYLNCCRAKLLTSLWLFEGSEGKSNSLPDDESDPGVRRREQAWEIAKMYPHSREFLEICKFIGETIKDQHIPANSFYWNGKKHFKIDALEIELRKINDRLEAVADTEGR